MKILLISYDYFQYDGRLRELIQVAKKMGEVFYISRKTDGEQPQEESHFLYRDHGYGDFILFCCRKAKQIGKVDIIFIDNRKGIIPGYLAKKITKAQYVVQDCRELYNIKDAVGIAGKIGCIVEKVFIPYSDVVIAANAFRAKLMVQMFGLLQTPLNYENIRKLVYTSEQEKAKAEAVCKGLFEEKKFRIVSTAGCDLTRTTSRMLEAMKVLGNEYELLLIGDSEEEDEILVVSMIREMKLTNVKILPKMDQNHLKYVIENSQVGMVAYHQRDLNNKYCASGKIFEFLFEGKPVITSTNPPLKMFCKKYAVGIADDQYENAIRRVKKDYQTWQTKVQNFIKHVHVEKNNQRLALKILEELGEN